MAANRRVLEVAIISDASQYSKGFKKAEKSTKGFGKSMDKAATQGAGKLDSRMKSVGVSLTGLIGGFAAFKAIQFGRDAIDRAEAMNSAYAITEQVLEKTGNAANVTSSEMQNLAREQALLTGIDKQLVLEGNNVLLTFKNLRNEVGEGNDVFNRASALMLDVSAVMGTDAKSAALQLGKALNDPVSQMGALSRAGLTFSKAQQDAIKGMVSAGDLMGAQKEILKELESQLGGTAEASADATDKIKVGWQEASEVIGQQLLPALENAVPAFLTAFKKIAGAAIDIAGIFHTIGNAFDGSALVKGQVDRAFLKAALATDGFVDSAEEALLVFQMMGDGADGNAEAMEHYFNSLELTTSELIRLNRASDGLLAQFGLSATAIPQFREEIGVRLPQAMSEAADEARRVRNELAPLAPAFDSVDAGMARVQFEKVLKGFGGVETQVGRSADELQRFQDEMLELVDPVFAAARAAEGVAAAQQAANEALGEFNADSPEYERAVLDLAEAQARENAALSALPDNLKEAEGGLVDLVEQADGGAAAVDAVSNAVDRLDGKTATAEIRLFFESINASESHDAFQRAISGKAAGGPVTGGSPYIVGEQGPELFVPDSNGSIVPNHQLSGGINQTIIVEGDATEHAVEDIQRELVLQAAVNFAETG